MSLEELEQLTRSLPVMEDLIKQQCQAQGPQEYKVEQGTVLGFEVDRDDRGTVTKVFFSQGTVFPEHQHKSDIEHGIICKGRLKVLYHDGKEKEVGVGEVISMYPGEVQGRHALEDTWAIFVTIPQQNFA